MEFVILAVLLLAVILFGGFWMARGLRRLAEAHAKEVIDTENQANAVADARIRSILAKIQAAATAAADTQERLKAGVLPTEVIKANDNAWSKPKKG